MDLFGYKSGKEEIWEDAFNEYVTDVATALDQKAASLQKDATDSPDLLLVNSQLVNKWYWIVNGVFTGQLWSTPTRIPLLTQSVIKVFDSLMATVASGFSAVCESLHVLIHITDFTVFAVMLHG